jgi:hypothetical protein
MGYFMKFIKCLSSTLGHMQPHEAWATRANVNLSPETGGGNWRAETSNMSVCSFDIAKERWWAQKRFGWGAGKAPAETVYLCVHLFTVCTHQPYDLERKEGASQRYPDYSIRRRELLSRFGASSADTEFQGL